MFNYLYYKIYQATLKSWLNDIVNTSTPIYFGGLIGINFLVLYLFFAKMDWLPNIFNNSKQAGLAIAVFIILSIAYFGKKRREAILKKYSGEQNIKRIRGNIIVISYVVISFISIYVVAFFRPGKL